MKKNILSSSIFCWRVVLFSSSDCVPEIPCIRRFCRHRKVYDCFNFRRWISDVPVVLPSIIWSNISVVGWQGRRQHNDEEVLMTTRNVRGILRRPVVCWFDAELSARLDCGCTLTANFDVD
jgi:hypothetical protein